MITAEELANAIVRDVAELPDRNSPEGWPEAMIVTADELRLIVQSRAAGVRGAGDAETIAAEMEAWADNQNWPRHQHDRVDIRNLAKRVRRLATPQPPNTIRVDVEQIGSCELDVRDGVAYMPDVTVQDIVSKSCLKPQPPKDADCPSNESPGDSLSLRGAAGRSVSRPAKGAGDNPSPDSPIMKWAESAIADRNGAKDAGAVPIDVEKYLFMDDFGWKYADREMLIAYGNAREAAANSDIPRELWDWLDKCGLLPDIEDDGTVEWANIMQSLQVHEDALLDPIGGEPAARAQVAVGDPANMPAFDAGLLGDGGGGNVGWWHECIRHILIEAHDHYVEQAAELASISAGAHPSPAHAGAGDAEALTHEVRRWCSGDGEWSNWQPCTAEKAAEYKKDDSCKVRRLAGGDHA